MTARRKTASARKTASQEAVETGRAGSAKKRAAPVARKAAPRQSPRRPLRLPKKTAADAPSERRCAPRRDSIANGGRFATTTSSRRHHPSLDLDRSASAARTGRQELRERYDEHTETSPALTGGDVDADWESAYSVGDEAPGGDNPTPDQDLVDDIGRAVGVEYQDNEELKGEAKIAKRDRQSLGARPGVVRRLGRTMRGLRSFGLRLQSLKTEDWRP